jgi:hypothetical protein
MRERPGRPGTAIEHRFSIHEDLEFVVLTTNHLDIDFSLAAKPGRQMGGMQPGDSVDHPPSVPRTM